MSRACTLALLAATLALCRGQMSMSADEEEMLESMGIKGQPMGRRDSTPKSEVVTSDLPFIRCDVCRRIVHMAYDEAQRVLSKRFQYKPKRKGEIVAFDGEEKVQEFIEKICVADKPNEPGVWIKHVDLVASQGRLELRDHEEEGHCRKECRTVERACEEVVDAADTDFSEILWNAVKDGTDLEKVQRLVCNRSAKVCKNKPPELDPKKRKDYKFKPMTPDEKQMADMMANLKESGMGGTMYKRDDLMAGMDNLKEHIGDTLGPEAAEMLGSDIGKAADGGEEGNDDAGEGKEEL